MTTNNALSGGLLSVEELKRKLVVSGDGFGSVKRYAVHPNVLDQTDTCLAGGVRSTTHDKHVSCL